jgi:four helix bundle protein
VCAELRSDSLWSMAAYRFSAYLADLVWCDIPFLRRRGVGYAAVDQLYRAIGSIGANLAEGYSRSSGIDRVRFFEYSLGSTRESIHWYFAVRHALAARDLELRFSKLTEIRRILLTAIPAERARMIRPAPR